MSAVTLRELDRRLDQLSLAARLAQMRPRGAVRVSPAEVLRTPRLLIRGARGGDRREFVRAVEESRAELDAFMPVRLVGESDEAMFARQVQLTEAGDETGRDWRRLVFDLRGGFVGAVNLNDIRNGLERRAELTFWVRRGRCGEGIGPEIVTAAMEHAFEPPGAFSRGGSPGLGLDRVSALVSVGNSRSMRLLTRLGFGRVEMAHPVELSVSGRIAAHVEYRAYAATASAARTSEPRPAGTLPAKVGHGLKQVLRIEAANQLRVV